MNSIPHRLWNDDAGFIVSIELILLSSIAIIGLIVGMTTVRNAVVSELSDVAGAIQDLNQSYLFNGITGHSANTAGSSFTDLQDYCDEPENTSTLGDIDNCITFTDATTIADES